MLDRTVAEALLLARDPAGEVDLASPRLAYIWRVSRLDLFYGLRVVGNDYAVALKGLFGTARTVQVAGLVLVAAGLAATAALLARPLSRRAAAEALLVAELLGQLPATVDCEGLLAAAMGLKGGGAGASAGAGGGGGGASVGGGGGLAGGPSASGAGSADDGASSAGGH
jgi:hypothetical protein